MSSAGAPVCVNHSDRPAYVSCQRCGRHICPECQTPGAVGVICPDCFSAERRSTPARVRRAGLIGRANGAIATYAIMAITLVVFVLQLIPGLGVTNALLYAGAFSAPGSFEPWRMFTTMFVHSTGMLLHVGLNMYTLWIFGRLLEPFIGTWRFVALYLISGLAGSVGVLWLADPFTPVVGASGAIFGVIGAFMVIHRSLGGNTTQLYLLVGLNLVIGFMPGTGIAWQAHIGGLVGGAAVGWLFANTRRTDQQARQKLGLVAITVALLVFSLRYVVLGA